MNIDNVNTDDIKVPESHADCLKAIFEKQLELMFKYDPIELKNGAIIPHAPYVLDDRFVQYRLKDLFWRVTEEFAEALEVYPGVKQFLSWREVWENEPDVRHFYEEIADAIHFMVEASHIGGFFEKIPDLAMLWEARMIWDPMPVLIRTDCAEVVWELGLTANTLKNKPWKNTHMTTDKSKFNVHFQRAWVQLFKLLNDMRLNVADVFLLYFKKNEVNQFRQRSNY